MSCRVSARGVGQMRIFALPPESWRAVAPRVELAAGPIAWKWVAPHATQLPNGGKVIDTPDIPIRMTALESTDHLVDEIRCSSHWSFLQ
jgi:hypothetical protein